MKLTESHLRKIIKEELKRVLVLNEQDEQGNAALQNHVRNLSLNFKEYLQHNDLTENNGFIKGIIPEQDLKSKFGTFTDDGGRKLLNVINETRNKAIKLFQEEIGNNSEELKNVKDGLAVSYSDDDRKIFTHGEGKDVGKVGNVVAYAVVHTPSKQAGQIKPLVYVYFGYLAKEKSIPITIKVQ